MGTTADKLEAAIRSKEDIRLALEQQGVDCDKAVPFSQYGNKVREIKKGTIILGMEVPGTVVQVGEHRANDVEIEILEQPTDTVAAIDSYAFFHTIVVGNGLNFQWQMLKDGDEKWTASSHDGNKSSILKIKMKSNLHASRYRCVITDHLGVEVVTNEAWLMESTGGDE